jgi:hypothetical protein
MVSRPKYPARVLNHYEARGAMNSIFQLQTPEANRKRDGEVAREVFGAWEMQLTYDARSNMWQIDWHAGSPDGSFGKHPLMRTNKHGRLERALAQMYNQAIEYEKKLQEQQNTPTTPPQGNLHAVPPIEE